MKLLLTSGGVTNPSIRYALVELLGKPIAECHRPLHPHRAVGSPDVRPGLGAGLCRRPAPAGVADRLGWASLGVLELYRAAHHRRRALGAVGPGGRRLLVDGGDATYLCHWMRESGLADLLPSLPDTVWVGVSAGSMVMTPRIGASSSNGRPRRTTAPSVSSTSRSSRTWTPSRRTPWPTRRGGPRRSAARPTPSTSRRPSASSRAPSRWYPKASGRSSGHSPRSIRDDALPLDATSLTVRAAWGDRVLISAVGSPGRVQQLADGRSRARGSPHGASLPKGIQSGGAVALRDVPSVIGKD